MAVAGTIESGLPSGAPFAITKHDTNAITPTPNAVYVGTGGTIVLRGVNGTADVTFKNVQSGQILDVRPSHIRATGTTAADFVGLF